MSLGNLSGAVAPGNGFGRSQVRPCLPLGDADVIQGFTDVPPSSFLSSLLLVRLVQGPAAMDVAWKLARNALSGPWPPPVLHFSKGLGLGSCTQGTKKDTQT